MPPGSESLKLRGSSGQIIQMNSFIIFIIWICGHQNLIILKNLNSQSKYEKEVKVMKQCLKDCKIFQKCISKSYVLFII